MKVTVVGAGYVGLSIAAILSRFNPVCVLEVLEDRVEKINSRIAPIRDEGLNSWFAEYELDLVATTDTQAAYADARFVIVAVPTNYDENLGEFDTSLVDGVVKEALAVNPEAVIVIKSTVPIGYTDSLKTRFPQGRFLFSPEFLREGHALDDNAHPTRIVVGIPEADGKCEKAAEAARTLTGLLAHAALDDDVPEFVMSAAEAEAVKLFANTYLAMRVAYFNELDSYAAQNGMDAGSIIAAVGADPRIGTHYNNPSFGYGGYCLPKDTKQLYANFAGVPQDIIGAVVRANETRKDAIVADIERRVEGLCGSSSGTALVGVHRLVMKQGADNFRSSATVDVAKKLMAAGLQVLAYEPLVKTGDYQGIPVTDDLETFKKTAALIVANRYDSELSDVREKVYTRDLYGRD